VTVNPPGHRARLCGVGAQPEHRHTRRRQSARALIIGSLLLLGPLLSIAGPRPAVGAAAEQAATTTTVAASTASTSPSAGAGASPTTPAKTAVNDRSSTRKIQTITAALAALGLLFAGLVVWYWRSTKPVPAHLEGLDLLATRKFQKAPDEVRDELLADLDAQRAEPREASIVPDAQILPDGHVGEIAYEQAAATELGRASNGARIVSAPSVLRPPEPQHLHVSAGAPLVSPDPLLTNHGLADHQLANHELAADLRSLQDVEQEQHRG
jgi:hypothetical protein